jgi:hypothetical protein
LYGDLKAEMQDDKQVVLLSDNEIPTKGIEIEVIVIKSLWRHNKKSVSIFVLKRYEN